MNKKLRKMLLVFCFAIACLCSFMPIVNNVVYASSISMDTHNSYTNVMDDLRSDPNFNEENYPANEKDYSLDVIQVAESNSNELFIYVYQPSGAFHNLIAKSIMISQTLYDNANWNNYTLTLLNNYGVFYKYKVDNFTILEDMVRYYDISSILREFNDDIDSVGNDNTISEVGYEVAKRFTACTINGEVSYTNVETEVVVIEHKWIATMRYTEGWYIEEYIDEIDRHICAFSTDYRIDQLYEIDIEFWTRTYTVWDLQLGFPGDWDNLNVSKSYDENSETFHDETIVHDRKLNIGEFWGINSFEWDYIESKDEFLANNENLPQDIIDNVQNKEWVFTFYTSDYGEINTPATSTGWGTETYDTVITRLKFETDGVVYNLGVVDSKQTGSGIIYDMSNMTFEDMIRTIVALILLILIVVVLAPILPSIFSFIFAVIKIIIKVVWWVVSLPFKIIKSIFKGGGKT